MNIEPCYICGMDGARLRELRRRYGLTQVQVARAASMAQPDLSAIEAGRRGIPETRARVLAALRSLVRPSDVLDDEVRQVILSIFDRFGATDVRLFGSVARGDDGPGSDIDLIATFPEDFDLLDLMTLEQVLEDALGLAVDVVADTPRVERALARTAPDQVSLRARSA